MACMTDEQQFRLIELQTTAMEACVKIATFLYTIATNRLDSVDRKLDQLLTADQVQLGRVTELRETLMANSVEMQRLTDEVAQTKTIAKSAVTLLGGLSQQIRDTAGDREAALTLANELDSSNEELAAAITANTPQTTGGGTDTGAPATA